MHRRRFSEASQCWTSILWGCLDPSSVFCDALLWVWVENLSRGVSSVLTFHLYQRAIHDNRWTCLLLCVESKHLITHSSVLHVLKWQLLKHLWLPLSLSMHMSVLTHKRKLGCFTNTFSSHSSLSPSLFSHTLSFHFSPFIFNFNFTLFLLHLQPSSFPPLPLFACLSLSASWTAWLKEDKVVRVFLFFLLCALLMWFEETVLHLSVQTVHNHGIEWTNSISVANIRSCVWTCVWESDLNLLQNLQ